ncbi:MAG: FecCD family ABC transporter permease [Kurthia gibsonii]|uniref:Probable heme-iron transport system permease protein IsdF n=1 Tax=Kurthia gibsonii TaxID=33946 RepID=A0ABU9LK64_9BACL|nr:MULTISPECIES: iron ABC transporter permease [Kurthia]AMA62151.1 fecCD transport family protein [Kurthia sp. 11kri321]MCA9724072.1 iron ABC transporter permease [Kurthia sp.]MEB6113273.1 iron ABC transporter permease [Kurthia gibsonii]WIL37933.1 iron ABC transporter permease [Kurthia sp. YJT4]
MKKIIWMYSGMLIVLIVILYLSLTLGSIPMTISDFVKGIFGQRDGQIGVIFDLRLPRVLIALFAGAALGLAGALLQAAIKNPLADPGIIGITTAAMIGNIVVINFLPHLFFYAPIFAFAGGIIAFLILYTVTKKYQMSPIYVLLVGIALNAMFTAIIKVSGVTAIHFTESTGLSMKTWDDANGLMLFSGVGIVIALFVGSWCNVLGLSEKTIRSIGFPLMRVRWTVLFISIYLASVATAIVGSIAFIGLLVPHISRLLVGSDYRFLLPFSALFGAALLLVADTIGRTIIPPYEITASVIMALIGGPFLILLIRKFGAIYGH